MICFLLLTLVYILELLYLNVIGTKISYNAGRFIFNASGKFGDMGKNTKELVQYQTPNLFWPLAFYQ